MAGIGAIVKKELKSVMKEKTIVLAIVIQLLIASLSSVILVGLISYYDPGSIGQNANIHLTVGVVGDTNSQFVQYLQDSGFNTRTYKSVDVATAGMEAGRLDTVVYIPDEGQGVVNMQLYLPRSDSKSTVITMMMKTPLEKYENYLRDRAGVHVNYTDMSGKSSTTYEFLYSLIVPMLMLFPAFIAGSMIIDSISEEVENKTLDTLLTSPASLNTILGGKIVAAVSLSAVQCVMWWLLLSLNRLYIQNVALVLLLAFIISSFVTFGSALVSMYFKDRERSQFAYSVLLMTAAGASMFFNPSPISLMARLAMNDVHVGLIDVLLFALPLLALIAIFFLSAKRLLALKA